MSMFDKLMCALVDFVLIVIGMPHAVADRLMHKRDGFADRVVAKLDVRNRFTITNHCQSDTSRVYDLKDQADYQAFINLVNLPIPGNG